MKRRVLKKKVKSTLKKARRNKKRVVKQMKRIQKWKYQAIKEVYEEFRPRWFSHYRFKGQKSGRTIYGANYFFSYKKFWRTVYFFRFGKLLTVNQNLIRECDSVLQGYNNQLSMRQSQLYFFNKLEGEYNRILRKLEVQSENEKKIKKLKDHGTRLKEMDDDISSMKQTYQAYTGKYGLENIRDEFEMTEEVYHQMNKLEIEYGEKMTYENSLAFKDEIDKIIKELE